MIGRLRLWSGYVLFFYVEGRPYTPGKFLSAEEKSVDPRYFTAAGIPLLRGRWFTNADGVGPDPQHPRLGKTVISQAMAKAFFDGEDPIGNRVFFDFEVQRERLQGIPAPRYEIVGIVGDVVPALEAPIRPSLYRPLLDLGSNGATILVLRRSAARPSLEGRRQTQSLEPSFETAASPPPQDEACTYVVLPAGFPADSIPHN